MIYYTVKIVKIFQKNIWSNQEIWGILYIHHKYPWWMFWKNDFTTSKKFYSPDEIFWYDEDGKELTESQERYVEKCLRSKKALAAVDFNKDFPNEIEDSKAGRLTLIKGERKNES